MTLVWFFFISIYVLYSNYALTLVFFIVFIKAESTSFAIGYIFYYWEHYKNMIEFDCNNRYNNNDHSGHKISALYVSAKYSSFMEEMSNYPNFNIKDYFQIVQPKVNEFFNTKKVRKINEMIDLDMDLKYGIKRRDPIHKHHLLSLVLYIDFTALSSDFSASFRSLQNYEIKITKKRNKNIFVR